MAASATEPVDIGHSGNQGPRASSIIESERGSLEHAGVYDPFKWDHRLRKVRALVERDISRTITAAQAAQIAALEEHYFSVFFKKHTGRTFVSWYRELRVAQAISLMKAQRISLSRIALEVGYSNLTSFGRAFRIVTGITPRAYRMRLRRQQSASLRRKSTQRE